MVRDEVCRLTASIQRLLGISACFMLFGCASAAEKQATKMDAALTPYVGRSIADY
jgi:hypothetical protein